MSFGKRLKQRRGEVKLTQKGLADLVGVSRSAVNSWEMGDHIPGGEPASKLPAALQCSWEWLTTGKESKVASQVRDGREDYKVDVKPVPVIQKADILPFLNGDEVKIESNEAVTAWRSMTPSFVSDKVFAYRETSSGMAPKIETGGIIVVDPGFNKPEPDSSKVWAFRVGEGVAVGMPQETARGMMLHFQNQAPGWEPIPVTAKECIGRVVWYVPIWV